MINHLFALNLLAFGDITDSNLFPTLLFVEPAYTTDYTLPVNKFSLPILKSTQLSFFMFLSCRRAGLADSSKGD